MRSSPFYVAAAKIVVTLLFVSVQYALVAQAGHCFSHRMNNICYDLTETDVTEDQCSTSYFSDGALVKLDGYIYAEQCRNVHSIPKRCDVNCGLGQECQWIDGEEMCVCSPESCLTSDAFPSKPLCASNNMTFASACAMEAWKCMNYRSALYKKYDGECQKDCRNVKCPDGKVCQLVKNTGEPLCYTKAHCNPALNPEPVCGTNGVTYRNMCTMRLSTSTRGRTPDLAHKGQCQNTCRPDLCQSDERCVYSKKLRPVCIRCQYPSSFWSESGECGATVAACGDDGQLYDNYCAVLRNQCEKNQYIQVIDYQTCPNRKRKTLAAKKFDFFDGYSSSRMF